MEHRWEKITSGDLFTLEEFIKNCKSGGFTDYDGFGYYSDGEYEYEGYVVLPSYVLAGNVKRKFSHVIWFNR